MAGRRWFWSGSASPLLVALVAVAAACSPAAAGTYGEMPRPSESPPPSAGVVPTIMSVNGLTLPSEAYQPTHEQRSVVDTAIDTVIAECMSRFGFAWEIRPPVPPVFQMPRMYGIGDMERAQQYGYQILPDELGDPALDVDPVPTDPAFDLVLSGDGDSNEYQGQEIPVGGCIGEAHRAIAGPDPIDPTLLAQDIGVAAYLESKSDPRVEEVVAAWSECMRDAGYDYPAPQEALATWDMSGTASEAEIQAAVADMTCKQQTNLIGVWYTVQSEYEQELIQQYAVELTEIMNAWAEATRRAEEFLAGTATQ